MLSPSNVAMKSVTHNIVYNRLYNFTASTQNLIQMAQWGYHYQDAVMGDIAQY